MTDETAMVAHINRILHEKGLQLVKSRSTGEEKNWGAFYIRRTGTGDKTVVEHHINLELLRPRTWRYERQQRNPRNETVTDTASIAERMATIEEKTRRLEAARQKVEAFVKAGGDLKSHSAVPVGMEFVLAFADLAKDFGYEILKPINK